QTASRKQLGAIRVRIGAPSPDHDVSARCSRRSDPCTRRERHPQCPPHPWTSRKVSPDLHRQPEKEQWLHLAPSELARPRGRMCDLSHSQPAMKKSASHSTGLRPLRVALPGQMVAHLARDRKSTRLNSSHVSISYAVF